MKYHVKGQDVQLLWGTNENALDVFAASTSCDLSITANTVDASDKDQKNPEIDDVEFSNYSWTMSNESFVTDIRGLQGLISRLTNGENQVYVQYNANTSNSSIPKFVKKGVAIITSLDINAANGELVKMTISLEGNGVLEDGTYKTITKPSTRSNKIKGKALMICERDGSVYKTFACAKSHKLNISWQTSDVSDKDCNDVAVLKEATGLSVTLSTENLIEKTPSHGPNGNGINDVYSLITSGRNVELYFGYYEKSLGKEIHGNDGDKGWADPDEVLFCGKFLCTNFSTNAGNKEDVSYTADFKLKEIVTPVLPTAEGGE